MACQGAYLPKLNVGGLSLWVFQIVFRFWISVSDLWISVLVSFRGICVACPATIEGLCQFVVLFFEEDWRFCHNWVLFFAWFDVALSLYVGWCGFTPQGRKKSSLCIFIIVAWILFSDSAEKWMMLDIRAVLTTPCEVLHDIFAALSLYREHL